jgi:hypothetical protein
VNVFLIDLGVKSIQSSCGGDWFSRGDGCQECWAIGVPNYTGMPKIYGPGYYAVITIESIWS